MSTYVEKTAEFIKQKFEEEGSGHDWWHMYRVWQLAKHIAKEEKNANLEIVELGALLHDVADFKFHDGDLEAGPQAARQWMESMGVSNKVIDAVEDIVRNISFKGAAFKNEFKTLEGKIVYDADKLDSIGAIGIARVFAYTGAKGNLIHHPDIKPKEFKSFEEYAAYNPTSVNHFYEKLLLLKDRMQTKTGKKMAEHRHKVMEDYLEEFYAEWDGRL